MDYVSHLRREADAFELAARRACQVRAAAAPAVPSCPGWTLTDLVLHLGTVHRLVATIIAGRLQEPPATGGDLSWLGLPPEQLSWLPPQLAPSGAPLPPGLADWFAAGAATLVHLLHDTPRGERVWTWSGEQSAGFWQRMQAIEAAVHRWDAENATGQAQPIDADLAADAIGQTFDVMVPIRRARAGAPAGQGERFLFTRTDGPGTWAARFDGDDVRLGTGGGPWDVRLAGTASDLMLFLWRRAGPDVLDVQGDDSLADRYFVLVPPM